MNKLCDSCQTKEATSAHILCAGCEANYQAEMMALYGTVDAQEIVLIDEQQDSLWRANEAHQARLEAIRRQDALSANMRISWGGSRA